MPDKQFLVIGAGLFGRAVATALFEQGSEVVLVDHDEASVDSVKDRVNDAFVADATEPDTLEELGVEDFDAVVVAIGDDLESTVLATTAAASLGAQRIVAKATSDLGARVLRRVGADSVIRPERDIGFRVARQLTTSDLVDAFNLGDEHAVIEIGAAEPVAGALRDLDLPGRFQVHVIAVKRDGRVTVAPNGDFEIEADDTLVVIGENAGIEALREHIAGDE